MDSITELCPVGLSKDQFAILSKGTLYTEGHSWAELLHSVDLKLAHVVATSTHNAYVNLPLARALSERIQTLHSRWDEVPDHAQRWCKAMVHYFLQDSDSDPDYSSPKSTHLFKQAGFPFRILQQVIRGISRSQEQHNRSIGRVRFAKLGVNRIGMFYEGLFTYPACSLMMIRPKCSPASGKNLRQYQALHVSPPAPTLG